MEENKNEIIETEDIIKTVEQNVVEESEIKENMQKDEKGMSIASMILGIVSIVYLGQAILSIACGVLAIVFGIKGKNKDGKRMAKAGFIMGVISLSIIAACFLAVFILGMTIVSLI